LLWCFYIEAVTFCPLQLSKNRFRRSLEAAPLFFVARFSFPSRDVLDSLARRSDASYIPRTPCGAPSLPKLPSRTDALAGLIASSSNGVYLTEGQTKVWIYLPEPSGFNISLDINGTWRLE
jgi:hypothetical protein